MYMMKVEIRIGRAWSKRRADHRNAMHTGLLTGVSIKQRRDGEKEIIRFAEIRQKGNSRGERGEAEGWPPKLCNSLDPSVSHCRNRGHVEKTVTTTTTEWRIWESTG